MAKYHYYQLFRRDRSLRGYLPDTAICSLRTLERYIHKYGTVYIKPNVGGRGEGVIKAWKEDGGGYAYIIEKGEPVTCSTVSEMYGRLGIAKKKRHVVQKGLQLSKYHGKRYDIRLMMIRNAKRRWRYAGMLAKTAGKSSIITNILRGHGEVVPIDQALSESHNGRVDQLKKEMTRVAYKCNKMYNRFRYDWQMGYDFGIDTNGRVWLIEANPRNPSHALFAKLKDRTLYNGIKRAVAQYKRANR